MNGIVSIDINPTIIRLTKKSLPYNANVKVNSCGSRGLGIRWYSQNPNIATVNSATGEITAKKVGITEIYVFPQDGDYCYAKLIVVVESKLKRFLKTVIANSVDKLNNSSKSIYKKGG